MTIGSAASLFVSMVVLALIPSISVMTVLARSVSLGLMHGAATSLGIVMGDIFYILLAIYGLSFLAETLGGVMLIIRYGGAAYLIWLGLSVWRSQSVASEIESVSNASLTSSFLAGFLLTLGDQKAVFFYLSFFPAFLDLSSLSVWDAGSVVAIAVIAVGGVKLCYALLADRGRSLLAQTQASRTLSQAAGVVMIAVGNVLLFKGLF